MDKPRGLKCHVHLAELKGSHLRLAGAARGVGRTEPSSDAVVQINDKGINLG